MSRGCRHPDWALHNPTIELFSPSPPAVCSVPLFNHPHKLLLPNAHHTYILRSIPGFVHQVFKLSLHNIFRVSFRTLLTSKPHSVQSIKPFSTSIRMDQGFGTGAGYGPRGCYNCKSSLYTLNCPSLPF